MNYKLTFKKIELCDLKFLDHNEYLVRNFISLSKYSLEDKWFGTLNPWCLNKIENYPLLIMSSSWTDKTIDILVEEMREATKSLNEYFSKVVMAHFANEKYYDWRSGEEDKQKYIDLTYRIDKLIDSLGTYHSKDIDSSCEVKELIFYKLVSSIDDKRFIIFDDSFIGFKNNYFEYKKEEG